MNGVVYGSTRDLPLGKARDFPPLPVLEQLPDEHSPTPRRRRTIVCANVTIDGERWGIDDVAAKMRDALRGDKADIRCDKRPGVQIAADYAKDVCLSSWCRSCPFGGVVAGASAPRVLIPSSFTPHSPVRGRSEAREAAQPAKKRKEPSPLVERAPYALHERHISPQLAAHGISRQTRTVAGVLDGTRDDPAVVAALAELVGVTP